MYIPAHFAETRTEVMHQAMRAHPLATLVTLGVNGLTANHIPLYLDDSQGEWGVLQGHVARANPFWRAEVVDECAARVEPLAIFQGPQAYISPSWYATKQESARVVPTWNYIAVHAYGVLRVIDDPDWLLAQLDRLTAHSEAAMKEPWHVSDAPADFTEKLLGAIVGIELAISRLEGKWKVSQNQPGVNQASVVESLSALPTPAAHEMARHIAARSKKSQTE